MSTIINGSSPSITFSDSTTQASAGLPLTGGNITGNLNVSGNVGIKTTSPTYPLETSFMGVTGAVNAAAASSGAFSQESFGTRILALGANSSTVGSFSVVNATSAGGSQVSAGLDSSGNWQINSGYGSTATIYGCRAWAAFNGTNGSIYGSGGISSVTRSSTGRYVLNFSFTMPDTNYATIGSTSQVAAGGSPMGVFGKTYDTPNQTTTSITVYTLRSTDATLIDYPYVNFCIYR